MTVLVEDLVAVFGIVVTVIGIFLSKITGNGFYDATSSLIIEAVLLSFAFFLTKEFKDLLIGKAISQQDTDKILDSISQIPEIKKVSSIKTMHLSTEDVLIGVNLVLADNLNMCQAETVTAKVENCIKQIYSHLDKSKIDIQYDNNSASKTKEAREETTD